MHAEIANLKPKQRFQNDNPILTVKRYHGIWKMGLNSSLKYHTVASSHKLNKCVPRTYQISDISLVEEQRGWSEE